MVDVKRRKGESFESLLRRFSRRIQQSGKMLEAKKYRFHSKDPNERSKKVSALRRLQQKDKREYLIKVGKFIEEKPKRGARR